ncbi:MAG: hypothetical protein WCI04_03715 [archaeon]
MDKKMIQKEIYANRAQNTKNTTNAHNQKIDDFEEHTQKQSAGEKSRFLMTKKHHLKTYAEAKKMGRMDNDFILLCDYISKTKNYFTSSSCAGRIALISLGKDETKQESAFYRKWHRTVTNKEVIEAINEFKGKILWLKQEPFILHLGTNTLDNARKLLTFCEAAGIKRAGIKVAKEGRFLVEMLGTQNIDLPIIDGKNKIDEKFLKYFLKKSNEKFEKNHLLINKMERLAKKMLD